MDSCWKYATVVTLPYFSSPIQTGSSLGTHVSNVLQEMAVRDRYHSLLSVIQLPWAPDSTCGGPHTASDWHTMKSPIWPQPQRNTLRCHKAAGCSMWGLRLQTAHMFKDIHSALPLPTLPHHPHPLPARYLCNLISHSIVFSPVAVDMG